MTSNARLIFTLLVLFAAGLLGTLLFALSFWSADNHWLVWCLTTLMHFQLAVWHSAGMLLTLLLGATLLRATIFIAASLLRKHQRATGHQKTQDFCPQRLKRAISNAGLKSVRLIDSKEAELYCFGWLHPTVIISQKMVEKLTLAELSAALRHEEYHRRHRHSLKLFLAEIVGQAIWFLPVHKDILAYLRYSTEVSADRFASGEGRQQHLRSALSKLLQSPAPTWQTAFAGSPAEARIESLVTQKPQVFHPSPSRTIQSLSVLAIVGSAVVLLAAPAQASAVQNLLQGAMTEHYNHCPQVKLFTPIDR